MRVRSVIGPQIGTRCSLAGSAGNSQQQMSFDGPDRRHVLTTVHVQSNVPTNLAWTDNFTCFRIRGKVLLVISVISYHSIDLLEGCMRNKDITYFIASKSSTVHSTYQSNAKWMDVVMLCHRSIYCVSWTVVLASSCLISLLWLQPIGGEFITSCSPSGSECSCSPEPIKADSCGVSNTTVCYEQCYDIFQYCFDQSLNIQETCNNICKTNAIDGDSGVEMCVCDCLESSYSGYNLCALNFNTCACGCESVNVPTLSPDGSSSGTSGSFLGPAAAIRTLMAAVLAVLCYM